MISKRPPTWRRVVAILLLGAAAICLVTYLGKHVNPLFVPLSSAHAGERDLVAMWTKPERNCDGSLLTNLAGYKAYWGKGLASVPGATASSFTSPLLPPGDWWLAVTAVNTAGVESPLAGPVLKTIAASTFKTTNDVVYTIVKRTDKFVMLPVGTIPLGSPCDPANTINGLYVVPRALVVWSGSVKPDAVVAKCD